MIDEIKKYDLNFDKDVFISKVDRIFIMILDALMEKNINNVKHYISNDIYNHYINLVNSYNEKGLTRIFDEMNIKSTELTGYDIKDNNIYITVKLISRYMDYFIDSNTGNYVSGVNNHRLETANAPSKEGAFFSLFTLL